MTKQKDKIKLSSLQKNKKNPRYITADKLEKLKASIESFEQMLEARPIVTDEDGVILGGNMRYEALKALGYKEIPAAWVKTLTGLTDEQKREFLIKDNVGFGAWDWDTLANEWESELLTDWGLDVPVMEYEEQTELEAKEDDYQAPENMKIDVMQGDLIEFKTTDGRTHRLLCGDSTNSDDVEKLMQGKKADMVFTDPPYGYNYESNFYKNGNPFGKLKNDDKILNFLPLLKSYINKNTPLFIFTSFQVIDLWLPLVKKTFEYKNLIVWKKNNWSMGDLKGAFAGQHELIIYCNYGRVELKKKRETDIWEFNRTPASLHPTQKPIDLIEFAIINTTENNCNILDPFLGSGSTLVAAHQLKRTCYGLELEPKYCQVIIDRMQKLDNSIKVTINGKAYEQQAEKIPF